MCLLLLQVCYLILRQKSFVSISTSGTHTWQIIYRTRVHTFFISLYTVMYVWFDLLLSVFEHNSDKYFISFR